MTDKGFEDNKVGADADFSFDNHDSAVADLGSENDGDSFDNDVSISDVETELRQFDALCYKNVRLLVVRNLVAGERDVLAIEVKLAYHKGGKRRLKPTIFFFTKVNDLIFYPITYLVFLAIADRAFEAPSLTTAERVFKHKFRDCLNRLGLAAGFLEKLTSYCFRRGTANVVDRTATDAVRDQVIRYNPNSAVYNGAYINERVPFDILFVVLERPFTDSILRMLT
ncbi:hypothetical protein DL98DRAFT_620728 [Cadophora sp. DSE1049]|nr:hypothetical protein DL98DRAFT_620728 [Cadophora sp. DSE1049]